MIAQGLCSKGSSTWFNCYHHLETVAIFQQRALKFRFAPDLTNYVAGPDHAVPTGEWGSGKEGEKADTGCVIGQVTAMGKAQSLQQLWEFVWEISWELSHPTKCFFLLQQGTHPLPSKGSWLLEAVTFPHFIPTTQIMGLGRRVAGACSGNLRHLLE